MAAPAGPDVDRLVRRFMPLAIRMADDKCARLPGAGYLHDDIRSAALLGLFGAAQRYDEHSGPSFVKWARQRIRGAMLDALRHEDILSRGERERVGPDAHRVVVRGDMARELLGFDIKMHGKGFATSPRVAVWSEPDQEDAVARAEMRDALRAAIGMLDAREAEILRLYWFGAVTQAELARTYRVTDSRINQILTAAHQHLRWFLELPS